DDATLPLDARRRLLAARALYARRRGDEEEARRLEKRAGLIERWFVGGPYSALPRLGLSGDDPTSDGKPLREVRARLGQVPLEAPRMRAGVLAAVTWVRAAADQKLSLALEAEQPWRLFVDGKLLHEHIDADHYPSHLVELDLELAAGWHRLT